MLVNGRPHGKTATPLVPFHVSQRRLLDTRRSPMYCLDQPSACSTNQCSLALQRVVRPLASPFWLTLSAVHRIPIGELRHVDASASLPMSGHVYFHSACGMHCVANSRRCGELSTCLGG